MKDKKYDCCIDIDSDYEYFSDGHTEIRVDAFMFSIDLLKILEDDTDCIYYSQKPIIFNIKGTKANKISHEINKKLGNIGPVDW